MVSWFDAASFCELLTERFGKRFRLPTEAEWEYACRAGTVTPFSTGNELSTNQANYDEKLGLNTSKDGVSRRATTPVNAFPPNPWGIHDLHGNVWEWCSDWYGPYPNLHKTTDPQGPDRGDIRILRGGSWFHSIADSRSAQRDALDPGRRHSIYGFRVALTL
jgi:formylglycine-generating enzyme required for sulfatase activity